MDKVRGALTVAAVGWALACGSSSSPTGTATVGGTVAGSSFAAKDAISGTVPLPSGSGGSGSFGGLVIASASPICSQLAQGKEPKNLQSLVISLADFDGKAVTPPAAPGSYTVVSSSGSSSPPAHFAEAVANQTDSSCKVISSSTESGVSGTVTLTSVAGGAYSGSFDLTVAVHDNSGNPIGTPDHLTGTFGAVACGALPALSSGASFSCQ